MTQESRQRTTGKTSSQRTPESFLEFEEHELRSTMEEFLQEEKKEEPKIWNFATIAGIAMFFVGMLYMIQMLGVGLGPDLGSLVELMPLLGGVLVTLVGFGFLVGDRKSKKAKKGRRKRQQEYDRPFEFEKEKGEADFDLENDLEGGSSRGERNRTEDFDFDEYALSKPKKLYKSRTDRKWMGICGGLAKYFGISSTVIRLLFVICTLAGWGTPILAYIGLAIVLDKEPPELMDDFDF